MIVLCAILILDQSFIFILVRIGSQLTSLGGAVTLDFIQCPFPNQIQFGLEKLRQKLCTIFQTNSTLVWKEKKMILQDADSKPNSDRFGNFDDLCQGPENSKPNSIQ